MALTLMKGSEAIAEAAIRAGARFFFGYPITPQTEIPEYMSARMPEIGGCFLQAESEVAAINMVYGAAGTGARVITSSSSPGISLMGEGLKKVAVVGGGLGCAIAYPQAKKLHEMGAEVDLIAGFRSKDIIILEDEMKNACTNLHIVTDDGSNGRKALVTQVLKELIDAGNQYDAVIAIGPMIMMKFVCETTRPYGIKTIVSMNTIMVDGTGMCGGCRLTVGGETKFACVDGPDFDGHLVDFDSAMRRGAMYKAQEKAAVARREEHCNLFKMEVK